MKHKFLALILFLFISITCNNVYASEYHSYGVTDTEKHLIEEEKAGKKNIISELEYRFLEKEDKDAVDYAIFVGLWVALGITITYLNKKSYIIKYEKIEDVPKVKQNVKNETKTKEVKAIKEKKNTTTNKDNNKKKRNTKKTKED